MKDKALSYLGIAMRSGNLVTGEESVLKAVRSGEAKLVVVAEDASDNTRKKYADKCSHYEVPLIVRYTRETIGGSIGKEARAAIAFVDAGLAKAFLETAGH